jgi:putative transposase
MDQNEKIKKIKEIKQALKEARRKNNTKMFQRYLAILLYLKGEKSIDEISDIAVISKRTVYNYISAYKNNGINGLNPIKHKGASQKLLEAQAEELREVIINQYPSNCGFPIDYNWTADLLRKHVEKKYGIEYSRSGMSALLKRMGFSYTRATYVLAKADPVKQEAFKNEFENVKKNSCTGK